MTSIRIDELEQAVVETAWIQWASLGTFVESKRTARSVVDPEALLLVSLSLRHRERRLWDVVASWAKHGSKLFSVQRVRNLQKRFPDTINDRLGDFATLAKSSGKDYRWRSLAGPDSEPSVRADDLWRAYPPTWQPAALMVRMRLGLGVGIVPDLLSFLLSLRGDWARARTIAEATEYSIYSVRRTGDNLAAGQLIERAEGKPVQYRAGVGTWSDLLGIHGDLPRWCYWQKIYAFAVTLIAGKESGAWRGQSRYMFSSSLRDLAEDHRKMFVLNQIEFPDPRRYPGEQYLLAFSDSVSSLAEWIRRNV